MGCIEERLNLAYIIIMDEGQLHQLYHQCAMEIKKENRFLGPLQIHIQSLQLLTKQPSFIESEARVGKKKKNNAVSPPWMIEPILSIRSIIAPRRTKCKEDLSKVVLPGRRTTIELDGHCSRSAISKMRNHQGLEFDGLSDLDYDTVHGGRRPRCREVRLNSNPAVEQGGESGVKDISGRTRERLGTRRSTLYVVDERRASVDHTGCGCGEPLVQQNTPVTPQEMLLRRSSIEVNDGSTLICEFPSRNTSHGYRGTLICDWERRQSIESSEGSLSNPEDLSQ